MYPEKLPLQFFLQPADLLIIFQFPIFEVQHHLMVTALNIINAMNWYSPAFTPILDDQRFLFLFRLKYDLRRCPAKNLGKSLFVNRFQEVLECPHVKSVIDIFFVSRNKNNDRLPLQFHASYPPCQFHPVHTGCRSIQLYI